jgi:hypothetical protein
VAIAVPGDERSAQATLSAFVTDAGEALRECVVHGQQKVGCTTPEYHWPAGGDR